MARGGDHLAFGEIVSRYKGLVAKTVIGMVGDNDEADDVGQEVFIRFYKSMDKFRGDSSLGTYLTRISINLSLNHLNAKNKRRMFSLSKPNDEGSKILEIESEDNFGDNMDAKEIIQKALEKLDIKLRSVVILRMIEGYSTKETADMLDVPLGTVLSRLKRAQDKLKEVINTLSVSYNEAL